MYHFWDTGINVTGEFLAVPDFHQLVKGDLWSQVNIWNYTPRCDAYKIHFHFIYESDLIGWEDSSHQLRTRIFALHRLVGGLFSLQFASILKCMSAKIYWLIDQETDWASRYKSDLYDKHLFCWDTQKRVEKGIKSEHTWAMSFFHP